MRESIFQSKRNVIFLAIFYTFLWGCAFPLVKLCMDGFGVSDNASKCLVAGIRFFISGAGLLVYCSFTEPDSIKLEKSQIKFCILYGVLGVLVQYGLTYIGLSFVDGSKGAIFDQLCVFVVILSSGLFFKSDKLTFHKVIGCMVGFLGILAVNTDGLEFTFSFEGEGIMILASVCQAVVFFLSKASCGKISAPKMIGWGQFIGGILLVTVSLPLGAAIPRFDWIGLMSLLLLSVISALAYVLSLVPLKYFPASEISVFNLLITVFGVIMSALLLGENIFRWNYLIAISLISVGIILVNKRQKCRD